MYRAWCSHPAHIWCDLFCACIRGLWPLQDASAGSFKPAGADLLASTAVLGVALHQVHLAQREAQQQLAKAVHLFRPLAIGVVSARVPAADPAAPPGTGTSGAPAAGTTTTTDAAVAAAVAEGGGGVVDDMGVPEEAQDSEGFDAFSPPVTEAEDA